MYLHCHNCGWEQDDFWDENYNPIKRLTYWEHYLLTEPDIEKAITEVMAELEYCKKG